MIVPKMGTSLASALFTPVQRRVLALLFGQPQRRFQSAELIRLARSGTGATHRQLQRLASSGLVLVTKEGNQKYYQANRELPIFPDLHGLILKTVGIVEPIRDALRLLAKNIDAAFVFGSVAKESDRADSDVDLFVLSEKITYPTLYEKLQSAETRISRKINPVIMTPAEWRRKRGADSFAKRIASQPKLFVIGDDDALS